MLALPQFCFFPSLCFKSPCPSWLGSADFASGSDLKDGLTDKLEALMGKHQIF